MLESLSTILLCSLVGLLCLCGLFGTAAVLLNGVGAQLLCRLFSFERPPGFLDNNENYKACMLLSNHKNSSSWFLYIGDRGVVDSLLNKTLISVPSSGKRLSYYFRAAHLIKLLAMTYVAAQKGWDGLTLLLLMLLAWALNLPYQRNQTVRRWLEANDVSITATSFEFTGRTSMLGAIHRMSGTTTVTWMDDILSPSARRTAWLNQLSRGPSEAPRLDEAFKALSPFDKDWVVLHSGLALQAVTKLQSELGHDTWA